MGHLDATEESLGLEMENNLVDGLLDTDVSGVDSELGGWGVLVGEVDTRNLLDLATARLLVETAVVSLLTDLDGSAEVHLNKSTSGGLDEGADLLADVLEGGDGGDDAGATGLGDKTGDVANTADVLIAVFVGEPELGAELLSDVIAVQKSDGAATVLEEGGVEGVGDRRLSGAGEAGEEDGESLGLAWGVALAEDLDDLGEGEPCGDLDALEETATELRAGDTEAAHALGDLVDLAVIPELLDVDDHLVLEHGDLELLLDAFHELLRGVGIVEVLLVAVLPGSGVVTSHNEVGAAIVLADNGVPHGLSWSGHTHSNGQQREHSHTRGVGLNKLNVASHSRKVIDITGFGHTNNRVDEDISLGVSSGKKGQFTMRSVHGVSGLETDQAQDILTLDFGTDFIGGQTVFREVVVNWKSDTLELTSNVGVANFLEANLNRGVANIIGTSENLLTFQSLVRGVLGRNVHNGDDSHFVVTQSNAITNVNGGGLVIVQFKTIRHGPNNSRG